MLDDVVHEIMDGVEGLENRMIEYSEMNSFLFNHSKIFMITSESAYKTAEYNYQPYTFKYGNYNIEDYMKQYV